MSSAVCHHRAESSTCPVRHGFLIMSRDGWREIEESSVSTTRVMTGRGADQRQPSKRSRDIWQEQDGIQVDNERDVRTAPRVEPSESLSWRRDADQSIVSTDAQACAAWPRHEIVDASTERHFTAGWGADTEAVRSDVDGEAIISRAVGPTLHSQCRHQPACRCPGGREEIAQPEQAGGPS